MRTLLNMNADTELALGARRAACAFGAAGMIAFGIIAPQSASGGTVPDPPSPTIPRPPQNPIPPPSPPVPNPPRVMPLAGGVLAQSETPKAPEPRGNPTSEDKSLSEKLNENEGVLKPPRIGDSEIVEPLPDANAKIKIIPPPGEPGGDPSVQPK
ncbi:MAG: hypothetical protein R3D51_14190 [Hyphomicrobiaceae bacterium]